MRESELPVLVEPAGRTVYVLPGTRLVEASAEAGVVLEVPCGGEGVCKKCRVRVIRGASPPTSVEATAFSATELQSGLRLACQSAVSGPTTIEILDTSLPAAHHKILSHTLPTIAATGDPTVRKQYVELASPRRGDDDPDLLRLEKVLGPLAVEPAMLRNISARLREAGFRGTAVMADGRLIDFEPGDTTADALAVAVDVGTTTLVSSLLDLATGRELAIASRLNPQTRFGDDVLSRIAHVQDAADGLEQLHEALTDAIDEMLGELCAQAGAARRLIYALSFAGNTTMQHLLCKVDPRPLGHVPFVPTMGRGLALPAEELAINVHPGAAAHVMPVIGGFVGGDTVAGILATRLVDSAGPRLLVDIGTNGEIVLWAKGKLTAASTAAGPAFEGARISHGMRGSTGAIEKVVVDGQLRINVIGDVPPVGLCGSGLIDAAAELLRHRLLTPEGRLQTADQLPPGVLPELAERITMHDGQVAFLLAAAEETGTGQPVVLTQRDFRELQLAAGAIRAGVTTLLRRAGLKAEDLEAVLLCGGFGNFIRRSNAQRIGLLPGSIPRQRIRFQGNTSLAGARMTAISLDARQAAEDLARRAEHVDLSAQPEFRSVFADSMIFPGAEE